MKLARVVLASALLWLAAPSARGEGPDAYARQWTVLGPCASGVAANRTAVRAGADASPLDCEGAFMLVLDEAVYRHVVDAGLGDLAAFNADGDALAFGPMPPAFRAPPPDWVARPWFAKAYAADTFNPAPLLGSYLSFFYSGEPIPEAAIIGLERTYEMAPYDYAAALYLARQLLSEKKGKLARSVLIPFALNPHESKFRKTMSEVMKLIEGDKVDEAYTKLAAELKKQEDEAEKAKKKG